MGIAKDKVLERWKVSKDIHEGPILEIRVLYFEDAKTWECEDRVI